VSIADRLGAALSNVRWIELSHPLEEGIPTYPTHAKCFQNRWSSFGDIARMNQLVIGEHSGTHVDAPLHFPVEGPAAGRSVDELPPDALIGPALVIRAPTTLGKNGMMPGSVIEAWEQEHGRIESGSIVFVDFGWAADRWASGEAGFAHLDGWPGLARDAAQLLADRNVRAVGTDCISLDSADGGRGELPAHFELLERGILIIENAANLAELPSRFWVFALPLPIRSGTGSPLRLMAVVEPDRP
jgi:kynurenine formamidase